MPLTNPAPTHLFTGPISPILHNGVTVFPSANAAVILAFTVAKIVTVSTAYFRVGVQSGNMDIGIADAAGNRLASTGTFAVPTAAVTCSRALTASVTLSPGQVYLAGIACDNATASFGSYAAAAAPTVPGSNMRAQVAAHMVLPTSWTVPANNAGIAYCLWFV